MTYHCQMPDVCGFQPVRATFDLLCSQHGVDARVTGRPIRQYASTSTAPG